MFRVSANLVILPIRIKTVVYHLVTYLLYKQVTCNRLCGVGKTRSSAKTCAYENENTIENTGVFLEFCK